MIKFIVYRENRLIHQLSDTEMTHLPRKGEAVEIHGEFFKVLAVVHRITYGIINIWCMKSDNKA